MKSLLSQTYSWTRRLSKSRFSQLLIFLAFFIDACIFPLPTTAIFIAVSLVYPPQSYYNALISVIGMVMGAMVGYALGHYLWLLPDGNYTDFAQYLFDHIPGFTDLNYRHIQNLYHNWGYSILLSSIILPIPYQLFSITAGVFDFNILGLVLATLLFQGVRFFTFAWLTVRYGEGVKIIFHNNLRIIMIIGIILFSVMLLSIIFGFKSL